MAPAARGSSKTHHPVPRNTHRGGIRKKSPQPRFEKDGDLVMDGVGETRGRPTQSMRLGAHTTRVPSRNKLVNNQNIAKAIGRSLNDPKGFNIRDAPRGPRRNRSPHQQNQFENYDQIAVRGWKQSEAAKNTDQGIPQLISFMDRKASRTDNLKIIQEVSQQSIQSTGYINIFTIYGSLSFIDKTIKRQPNIPMPFIITT